MTLRRPTWAVGRQVLCFLTLCTMFFDIMQSKTKKKFGFWKEIKLELCEGLNLAQAVNKLTKLTNQHRCCDGNMLTFSCCKCL